MQVLASARPIVVISAQQRPPDHKPNKPRCSHLRQLFKPPRELLIALMLWHR